MLCSCGGKKKDYTPAEEFLRPASIDYSGKDTAEINDIVNNYVAAFSSKQFDKASEMLYTVSNDSILPMSDKAKTEYVEAYSHMPIYKCQLFGLTLRSDKNNAVKLAIQIAKNGDIDKNIGVTYVYLNPVKVGGKWYLTLLDKDAEGVEDVYATK